MSGTLLPGPNIDVEVCLGLGHAAGVGVWDGGRWDADDWGQADTTLGDWVDVTCSVVDGFSLGAGASDADGVVTRWEAATAAFTLLGEEFDPRSGPWAGLIGPGLPVRIRWRPAGTPDWLVAFIGFVDDSGISYDSRPPYPSRVAATDGTRILAAFDGLEQNPVGQGETAAARVTRIADTAGWPADRRDITPGGVPVKATTLADNAWTMLLAVADTDLALLWITRDGRLAYRPQGKMLPPHTLAAVIGCNPNAVPGHVAIAPVDMIGQQPNVTRNVVSISRQVNEGDPAAATVTLRDESSIARYLPHAYSRTDLIHIDDAWSGTIAAAVLDSSAWPSTAPAGVTLDSRADPAATALLLGLEPSLSVIVDDGQSLWQCEPAGWKVDVTRAYVRGEIKLLDVTRYFGSEWDSAVWDGDTSKWGF